MSIKVIRVLGFFPFNFLNVFLIILLFFSLIVRVYLWFSECIFLCSGDGDFDFPDPKGVQECIQYPLFMLWVICGSAAGSALGLPCVGQTVRAAGSAGEASPRRGVCTGHLQHHQMRAVRFVCLAGAISVCFWLFIIKEFLKERYTVIQTVQYNTNTFKTELVFFGQKYSISDRCRIPSGLFLSIFGNNRIVSLSTLSYYLERKLRGS